MFERYTEQARRVVFRSRYEAAKVGSHQIEPAHLLVGILREAKDVAGALIGPDQRLEQLSREIEQGQPKPTKIISTSGDLPLSHESKLLLDLAAEEAERLKQREIGPGHLVLGLLRLNMPPADVLLEYGVTLEAARQHVLQHAPKYVPDQSEPAAPGRLALVRLVEHLPEGRWGAAARLLEALCEERVELSVTDSQGSFSVRYGVPGDQPAQ